jgi:hypothetical protein
LIEQKPLGALDVLGEKSALRPGSLALSRGVLTKFAKDTRLTKQVWLS